MPVFNKAMNPSRTHPENLDKIGNGQPSCGFCGHASSVPRLQRTTRQNLVRSHMITFVTSTTVLDNSCSLFHGLWGPEAP